MPSHEVAEAKGRFGVDTLQMVVSWALGILLGVTSVVLTVFILLHRGRGGGLSDMFGGGVTSSLGSSGVVEKNLNRYTVVIAVVWVVCIVGLGLLNKFGTL